MMLIRGVPPSATRGRARARTYPRCARAAHIHTYIYIRDHIRSTRVTSASKRHLVSNRTPPPPRFLLQLEANRAGGGEREPPTYLQRDMGHNGRITNVSARLVKTRRKGIIGCVRNDPLFLIWPINISNCETILWTQVRTCGRFPPFFFFNLHTCRGFPTLRSVCLSVVWQSF